MSSDREAAVLREALDVFAKRLDRNCEAPSLAGFEHLAVDLLAALQALSERFAATQPSPDGLDVVQRIDAMREALRLHAIDFEAEPESYETPYQVAANLDHHLQQTGFTLAASPSGDRPQSEPSDHEHDWQCAICGEQHPDQASEPSEPGSLGRALYEVAAEQAKQWAEVCAFLNVQADSSAAEVIGVIEELQQAHAALGPLAASEGVSR